jgi:hypothetical protein
MRFSLSVMSGDWGGASEQDVWAVAESAAQAFAAGLEPDLTLSIVLATWPGSSPMVLSERTGDAFIVLVTTRGNVWAQLVYQFSHEFCHVLADPTTWRRESEFAWFEESLCEVASLFALRKMAKTWHRTPPYDIWQPYYASLWAYWDERDRNPAHVLPLDADFRSWFAERLPELRSNPFHREHNTIIAKQLLPIFELDPTAWRSMRYLHQLPQSNSDTMDDFLQAWHEAAPAECRFSIELMAHTLGSRLEALAPGGRRHGGD